jgi:hypothetical protein
MFVYRFLIRLHCSGELSHGLVATDRLRAFGAIIQTFSICNILSTMVASRHDLARLCKAFLQYIVGSLNNNNNNFNINNNNNINKNNNGFKYQPGN